MGANLEAVHPVLGATDVEESVRFYQCLGFAVVFQDAPMNPKYVAVRRDNVELHIQWADKGQWAYPTDRPAFRFMVSDVDEIYQEFVESGGIRSDTSQSSPWASPKDTPWGTREFHLQIHMTIGSSDRGAIIFGEVRRESMIGINQLRLTIADPRVAQLHR